MPVKHVARKSKMQWCRLYAEVIDDPKMQRLPPHIFKTCINLWCLAAQNDGKLPSIEDIAFKLRLSSHEAQQQIDELIGVGLLDIETDMKLSPHNWSARQYRSDTSTERVRKHREKKQKPECNVSETQEVTVSVTPPETETDTEQSRTETKKEEPPIAPRWGAPRRFRERKPSFLETLNAMPIEGGSANAGV